MKVGIGYDIHKLVKGRKLILGGIEIKFSKGLSGHSDGDVLTHAIIDAILGALGKGDIGKHFPDTDSRYKNISSLVLLKETMKLLTKSKYRINNLDTVIIAEKPKIASYSGKIEERLASVLKVKKEFINIKAKTNEGLGEIGKGKAIACFAIVSILRH
ncbi:MAG: 2-C-methyl-D-erythritol 2,4-cyclodiphosphate synthase [bacterium (Candidatus Ratteibacteria) CG_4_10_14_3_um_filter_41_18]|uniref:2-C-methyl-D-erythritol 2,4-cyclodiphosphate synthase n=1 Tax=bacterium (Candidatus Ratteibacteria) CG_4_10_14_3_um_filter_41_18 TaxID=2014287 RepID=A0A2M7M286_9BACT|nr:MAG: 2-C-methyl-D-erythritol 2,4-cyclodiphosphate synthase [bacterium (Candidatus Ratteibacteria) CG_4_10_14_3_um_filter_41_18]